MQESLQFVLQPAQRLRARDLMDREYALALDISRLATAAGMSEAHFIRSFRSTFGETPNRYLQRRRVERAMFLLSSGDTSVTDVCFDVGFNSLGTFSRMFRQVTGLSPSEYRELKPSAQPAPTCFTMSWSRPSSFGEARTAMAGLHSRADRQEVEADD